MTSFKEVREKQKATALSLRRRSRPRYLGGKDIHFARDHYDCCRCVLPIIPGDEYRRNRFVRCYMEDGEEKGYFYFERYHLPWCNGPTEKEDRQMREEIERQREAEKETERHAA